MRKFTSLFALLLCFVASISVQAQEDYSNKVIDVIGDPIVSVDEIDPNAFYLITSVGRHNTDGQYLYETESKDLLFEAVAEGHSSNAAFQFELVDETHVRIKTITGNYFPQRTGSGTFKSSAFEPASFLIEPIEGSDGEFTLQFTNTSSLYLDANAPNISAWGTKSSAGGNGAFRFVYIELGDPTAEMLLDEVLMNIQFDETLYPRDVPGGYPGTLIDACSEAYENACMVQDDYGAYTEEEIVAAANALKNAYEALLAGQIKVEFSAGNYYLVSARIGTSNNMLDSYEDLTAVDAAYSNGTKAVWEENFDATLMGEDANPAYIWKIEAAGTTEEGGENLYTIKNLAFDQYLANQTSASTAYGFTANTSDAAKFTVGTSAAVAGFVYFSNSAVTTANNSLHAATSGKAIVNWTAAAGASAWYVVPVDDETVALMDDKIADMRAEAAQKALNDTLQKYYANAVAAREAGRTFTFDGTNDGKFPVGEGLLLDESQVWVYPADPDENHTAGLFDGEFSGTTTFLHTSWHASVQGTEPHYIQMDLREEVTTLVLKYAVRSDAGTPDVPYTVTLYGTNDASLLSSDTDTIPSSEWENLGDYTLNWQHPLLDADGNAVSVAMRGNMRSLISDAEGAGITSFELPKGYQYVRMAVNTNIQHARTGTLRSNGDGFDYWCISELRAYSAEYDPDCVYAHMDEAAINALESSLAAAKTELANELATQRTIDALKAAYEAFMAVFPDKNKLQAAINEAKSWTTYAVEGVDVGNYIPGSVSTFNATISDAQAAADGVLTYATYNTAMSNLTAATSAFAANLILPETGYYNIQSLTKGAAKDAYLVARNSSTGSKSATSGIGWGYAGANTSDYVNTLWYVQKLENGKFTFKNVATGYYMQNSQTALSGPIAQGAEPAEIGLRAARDTAGIGLNFIISDELGYYGNAQPGGSVFVVWNSANGNDNSAFTFMPAYYEGTMTIQLNKPVSVHTLPYEVMGVQKAYQVAGITDDGTAVALQPITENIPAGTPFVIVADTSVVKTVQAFLVANDAESIAYAREALTVNGLAGTLEPDTIDETCLVMNNLCTELTYAGSPAYQAIAPNSGYFVWATLQEMPAVPATDVMLALSEAMQTGIETILAEPVAPARQGVFTLQGQKVANTRNLPAGVYIVNGRKVLVK